MRDPLGVSPLKSAVVDSIACLLILMLAATDAAADPPDCRVYMYKESEPGKPTAVFSPYDRIVLRISWVHLPKGDYTFHAEWYNAFGEMQDASRFSFSLPEASDYAVETWLEMEKAGFLNRLFSASETTGYNVKFYGKWQVKIFLNGEMVTVGSFEVQ